MIVTVIATSFDEKDVTANNFAYRSKIDNHDFINNKTQYLSEEMKEQVKKKRRRRTTKSTILLRSFLRIWIKNDGKESSIWQVILKKKLVRKVRINNDRKEQTSFCIIDSQSVKNTDTTKNKGYDAGKKVLGIKRHIAVNSQTLPHAIYITTAEKNRL